MKLVSADVVGATLRPHDTVKIRQQSGYGYTGVDGRASRLQVEIRACADEQRIGIDIGRKVGAGRRRTRSKPEIVRAANQTAIPIVRCEIRFAIDLVEDIVPQSRLDIHAQST